uniref:Uncharacterized protein LOC114324952 n=1 Tax=Diabrotica virgifera virgifera TaxID=50390 RepID=A0A6P7F088_DIAVI
MNLYLDILLNIIVKTYFLDSRCLLVFTDEDNYFDYNGDIPVINIKVSKDSINPHLFLHYFGCKAVLIKTNNPVTVFEQFENEIRTSIERFNERKFLIAPGLHINENITNIFLSHSIRYVVDFVAITLADYSWNNNSFISKHIERYNLWTHKYVGFDYSQKELLDTWYSVNRSFVHNSNLYEYKLKNQMGRTLRMATFQYEPYSIPGETINDHKGSELYSMIIFAKYINATPELVINPKDYWGYIFDNWTGNGLVGNLADDKADIGFAALYTWEADYHFLDLSTALIRTGITCLVPAPKLAAGWLTPWYSYSNSMWALVGASFFTCVVVHFIMTMLKTKMLIGSQTYFHGFTPEEYKGTESSAMKIFAKEVNATYKFVINNQDYWGDIFENWTGNGLLGMVADDTVDIAFAAMGHWGKLHPYVDFSVTFVRSGVTCIVPAPLSIDVTKKSFGNSMLAMVKIFLVQCVDDVDSPPGRYGTLFMGLLFMYSLFLSSTYSSGLAAVMTLPRYNHPIETVQDLLDSGIPWVAPHEVWIYSISTSEVPVFKAIIKAFLAEPSEEKMREYSKTRDYTFALERLPQGAYGFPTYIHEDIIENFKLLKEDLYYEQLVVILRKSSVLIPVLNKYLSTVYETGLIAYWQSEAVLLFGNTHMSRAVQSNTRTSTIGKLKWTHVEGAFGVLIFGQLIGFLVFIFELGAAWYKISKRPNQNRIRETYPDDLLDAKVRKLQ